MLYLPKQLEYLRQLIGLFPGIGKKSAHKISLELATWPQERLKAFADVLSQCSPLPTCSLCGLFSKEDHSCDLCDNPFRQHSSQLCIVESYSDAEALERTGLFTGLYHVLGGVLNPLKGIGPDSLRLPQLLDRLSNSQFKEIVFALGPTMEGESTCSYLSDLFPKNIILKKLGIGIPVGSSPEYVDTLTLSRALENRQSLFPSVP